MYQYADRAEPIRDRERLNEEARKGCDSPSTSTKGSESTRNEQIASRLQIVTDWSISNRLLILRDYIVSAASQINAGGGSNGDNPTNLGISDFSLVATTLDKLCVEYKSFLMDLKLLPDNAEDNKAQAEQYALAA